MAKNPGHEVNGLGRGPANSPVEGCYKLVCTCGWRTVWWGSFFNAVDEWERHQEGAKGE